MKLSLAAIAHMCNGELSIGSTPELMLNKVVIDSRKIQDNTLFVAIIGDNKDGHSYVPTVISSHNNAAIVHKSCGLNLPNMIYVDDTVEALGLLSHNYRMQFNIPIVAITGSNGKTTVKEMLKSICNLQFGAPNVLATEGNLNNHLGMPLTLLNLNTEHKVAIIEMGMNHSGELKYLSMLARPTIAIINNVMLAHAGFFNDLTDIARAKGEIFSGLMENGIACINMCSSYAPMWQKIVSETKAKVLNYGAVSSFCFIDNSTNKNQLVINTFDNRLITSNLQVLGEHNKANGLTASVLALAIGCETNSISQGLSIYTGYKGRLEQKMAFNGALLIDDSYNANPDSVKAAILAINNLPKPHWFIFADLRELGKFSDDSHKEIAEFASDHGIDCLLSIGELSKLTHETFGGTKLHFNNNQDIVEYCMQHLPENATILVKGSNSMGLNTVVTQLTRSN